MTLHVGEHARERGVQVRDAGEEPVVRSSSAGVLPQTFGWIQFRAVGRQIIDVEPVPVRFEPVPDVLVFVIGGVVLNQERTATTIAPGELLQESSIRGCVED